MPQLPESVRDAYTPDELARRVQELRRLYEGGALSAAEFNDFVSAFRFHDDVGHLWSIGANSARWYRWDRTQWTQASPPRSLMLANDEIQRSSAWMTTAAAASRPAPAAAPAPSQANVTASMQCASCRKPADSGAFCGVCGGKLVPVAAQPVPVANLCSGCGAPWKPGTKFCTRCGRPAAQALESAPRPPVCPRCNKVITQGTRFCTGCGTPVAQSSVR